MKSIAACLIPETLEEMLYLSMKSHGNGGGQKLFSVLPMVCPRKPRRASRRILDDGLVSSRPSGHL